MEDFAEGVAESPCPEDGAPIEFVATQSYDKEVAWLYEIGAKTEWLDNRLRLNAAAFYTDYQDLQVFQLLIPPGASPLSPGVLIAQNASDAEIKGIELEFTIIPVENLTIQGSYTYLDTEYKDFAAPTGFGTPGGVDPTQRDGNPLRNAPEHAFNILGVCEWTLDSGATLAIQADLRFKDQVFQDPDVEEVASIPKYTVLDARISYLTPGAEWEVAAWAKNLNDEDYFLHNFPAQGSGFATPAPPRTYGLTVTWMM